MKHTFASNFNAIVRRDVFNARARRYSSSLEAALFPNNIAPEVFHNLIDTYRRHIPTWHRYWAVRRRALGVETLQPLRHLGADRQRAAAGTLRDGGRLDL